MKLNFELRRRLADRIIRDLDESKSLYLEPDKGRHFRHIAINTAIPAYSESSGEFGSPSIQDWSEEEDKYFRQSVIYLRRYLNLLKDFPDFRKGEFSDNMGGAFPDLQSKSLDCYKEGYECHGNYFIDLARNRLRGRSNRQTPSTHPS